MKYPTTFNPAKIVEKANGTRPYLSHAFLDTEGQRLIACNGHALVIVPVEPEAGDVSGPVTIEALKAASKAAKRSDVAEVSCNGELRIPNGASFPRPSTEDTGTFPDVDRVIPPIQDTWDVILNAELLAEIQKSLGVRSISIQFAKHDDGTIDGSKAIRIGCSTSAAIGVLMPCRR